MGIPAPTESARTVVTGASSGIGMELARALAARGYS
ncbi:MAG: short-chain dehydrogenase, partial [Actinomycetota bacterium]|nr:short-chain dehydrogenase [Actinomycetota bacterium]